ncbi:TerB family tellurite resistance protein [Streptomyces pathocidini]|uniref:TerB family tellurite resistance protein n=1 Tax=Streptomyces pathocidini TaxID=1650571 RepID=UPI0034076547
MQRVWGVRTTWRTVGDGEFFCPECGGDRNYRRRTGRRRVAVFGLPLIPRGAAGPVVECSACHGRFGTELLDHPTTTRFSAMLRDAVHTVALAVLAAGGAGDRTVREAAVSTVRGAGFEDCTGEQLLALVEALAADTGRLPGRFDGRAEGCADGCAEHGAAGGAVLAIELHEALEPLAPHLAPAGREGILLQGARIALADGPYSPAEHAALATVGRALGIGLEDTQRLLAAAARTPS